MSLPDILLAVAAGLALLWVLLPGLVYELGLTKLRSRRWEEPARAAPSDIDPAYARRFEQLVALGFRPVGATRESCWFLSPLKWYFRGVEPERWLAHDSGHTLANLFRLTPIEPLRFSIVTYLENGGRVRTTCPGTGFPSPALPGSVLTELTQVEPAELWAKHQTIADDFCADGNLAPRTVTFTEAMDTSIALDRRFLRAIDQTNAYRFIFASFVVPALTVWGLGFVLRHTFNWRSAAYGVCVGGLYWAWQRHVVFERALREAKLRSHERRAR